jgi:hemolysin activation/secretion protein
VDEDMKMRTIHPGEALALILASALCVSTPCLAAQSSNNARQQEQPQQTQQQPAQQQEQPQAQQTNQTQTFAGKVIKLTTGKYALLTGQTPDGKPSGHFLDDQENAQKYEGKQVTVTGTFDEASNMIHVTNIQAA